VRQAYFDSSAIVKLSHLEPHTTALIEYLESGEVEASTSVIAQVEVMRALRRAGAAHDQAVTGFYLLALDEEVREEAARLGSPQLRALDAIHLATALSIGDDELEFITYDDRQAEAARREGLTVVQPGRPV
jgi:predicted nucleic acid-binding protein